MSWPEWSSCETEFGSGDEAIVTSEDGRASLVLSPSGEEFYVEFTCSLSRVQNQLCSVPSEQKTSSPICQTKNDEREKVHQGRNSRGNETNRSRSCSPLIINTAQLKVMFPRNISLLVSLCFL